MREYLYRGKANKKWQYGDLIQYKSGFVYIQAKEDCAKYFVIPETVGEFAGITIKGVKAFEGDIVKGLFLHGSAILGVIAFQDGAYGLAWKRGNIDEFSPFPCMCNVDYEIIGNIHDNPELLEV